MHVLRRPAPLPHRQGLAGCRDIVDAQDLHALRDAEERGGERAGQAVVHVRARQLADEALARGAEQDRRSRARGRCSMPRAAPGCAPASCRSRCRDRRSAASAGCRRARTPRCGRRASRRRRARRRRSAGSSCMVRGSPWACIRTTGRPVSAATCKAPGSCVSAETSLMSATPARGRAPHHLRLARVDGEARPHARRQRLDHRHDPPQLLLEVDRLGTGPRQLRADVEDVGALRLEPQRVRDGGIRRQIAPAVREAVRRDVDDAHQARPVERQSGDGLAAAGASAARGASPPACSSAADTTRRRTSAPSRSISSAAANNRSLRPATASADPAPAAGAMRAIGRM